MDSESRHQCLFYEGSPSQQLPVLAAAMRRRLDEGQRCMYVSSRPVVAGMRYYLATIGIDVANEIDSARVVMSSEPTTSPEDSFDADLMLRKLEQSLDQALADGYKGLWVMGDMTWEFGAKRDISRLMEYEFRLEDLVRRRPELHVLCQYHQDALPREALRQALLTHRTLFINETLARENPHFVHGCVSGDHSAKNPELDETIAALLHLQSQKRGAHSNDRTVDRAGETPSD